jgi:hypothetical protein
MRLEVFVDGRGEIEQRTVDRRAHQLGLVGRSGG